MKYIFYKTDTGEIVDLSDHNASGLPEGLSVSSVKHNALQSTNISEIIDFDINEKAAEYADAITVLDSYVSHWMSHVACGDTERAERARALLVEKRKEIELEYLSND